MLEWVKKHKEEGERGCVYEREIERQKRRLQTV